MTDTTKTIDEREGISMTIRRASLTSALGLITADIGLKLAHMVFVRVYGQEFVDARSPLVITDLGDRWDIRSEEIAPGDHRLHIIISKFNARILELDTLAT